jgi:hypothetical protein
LAPNHEISFRQARSLGTIGRRTIGDQTCFGVLLFPEKAKATALEIVQESVIVAKVCRPSAPGNQTHG